MKLRTLWRILALLVWLVQTSAPAQTILGRSPYDKTLVTFYGQNTNANSTLIGLSLYGTVPLTLNGLYLMDTSLHAAASVAITDGILMINGSPVQGGPGGDGVTNNQVLPGVARAAGGLAVTNQLLVSDGPATATIKFNAFTVGGGPQGDIDGPQGQLISFDANGNMTIQDSGEESITFGPGNTPPTMTVGSGTYSRLTFQNDANARTTVESNAVVKGTLTVNFGITTTNGVTAAAFTGPGGIDTNQIWVSGLGTIQDFNCSSYNASGGSGVYYWNATKNAYTNADAKRYAFFWYAVDGIFALTNSDHHTLATGDGVIGSPYFDGTFFQQFADFCGNSLPGVQIRYATNAANQALSERADLVLANQIWAYALLKSYGLNVITGQLGGIAFPNSSLTAVSHNDASGLTNMNGATLQMGTVGLNQLDNTNLTLTIQGSQASMNMNLNRWGWKNTLVKLRGGQTPLMLYLGSGLMDIDRTFIDVGLYTHFTNSGTMAPYGYNATFAGGAYWTNDLPLWYDTSWFLPGSGSPTVEVFTNNPIMDVVEVDYAALSGGGTFKLMQNVNGGGYADVAGFTSVSTSAGTLTGRVARWTNSPALPTKVKVVYLSGGPVRILAASYRWTANTTNSFMTFHYTQQSSHPTDVVGVSTNVWVPIFQSWAPDLVLMGFNDGGADYLTNFFNQFMTNMAWYLPQCDVVYQGCYPAPSMWTPVNTNGFGNDANYYAFMRCREKFYSYWDAWNFFNGTNTFPARGLLTDAIHLDPEGSTLMANGQLDWLGFMNVQPAPQTPWTADEDAARYQLTNLSQLTFTNQAKIATGGNGFAYINPSSQTVASFPTNGNPITLGTNVQFSLDYLGDETLAGWLYATAIYLANGGGINFTNNSKWSWIGPFTGPNATGISIYSTNASIADFTGTNVTISQPLTLNKLTASRMVLEDSAQTLQSAAASGAVPIDADGTAATLTQLQNLGAAATNDQRALTLGNVVNVSTLNVTNNITNAVLTASRTVLTDANKALVSAAASGAVPIDADGTATTLTQLQNLGAAATNDQRALTLGNVVNVSTLNVTNNITNAVLSASRVVLTDANKALVSAAASGAVPIDADGTATTSAQLLAIFPTLLSAYPQAITNGDNRTGGVTVSNGLQVIGNLLGTNGFIRITNAVVGAYLYLDPTNFVMSNSVAQIQVTNGHIFITNYLAAGRSVDIDPANNGSVLYGDNNLTNYLLITATSVIQSNAYGLVELRGDSIIATNRQTGQSAVITNGSGFFGTYLGANMLTNSVQTKSANYSMVGSDYFVLMTGAHTVTLPGATTNTGKIYSITCSSAGTNAILTVSSQTIAGQPKWTNTAIFTCTQVISDGANWQICGTRGN